MSFHVEMKKRRERDYARISFSYVTNESGETFGCVAMKKREIFGKIVSASGFSSVVLSMCQGKS